VSSVSLLSQDMHAFLFDLGADGGQFSLGQSPVTAINDFTFKAYLLSTAHGAATDIQIAIDVYCRVVQKRLVDVV
jgi:hypothetical protein